MTTQRPFVTRSLPLAVLTLLFVLCSLPFAAHAQTSTATLSGTVVDQNGAVVAGADVTIINTGTGLQREAKTNDEGSFTVPLLPPSTYRVRAQHTGFTPIEITNVVLNVGDRKALKIELKAGDVNATVQVTSEAPLIDESPAVATTIDRTFVGNLPLSGRSFQSLILLTPGVVMAQTGSGDAGQFSVNGQRNNANYFTVDGVSANTGVTNSAGNSSQTFSQKLAGTLPDLTALGTTASLVSVDALEEFKIQTSGYSAEFGRQPGGQIQLVTRSGGNQFHGSIFDYLRNDVFDARNFFNKKPLPKPPLRQNQFGGTFSGPILFPGFGDGSPGWYNGRNRTFFFFSYEGLQLRLPITINTMVPSQRIRQLTAPALQPFVNMISLPTGPETTTSSGAPSGVAPFVGSYSSPSSMDATSIRLDHTVNSKLQLFGRYSQTTSGDLTRQLMEVAGDKNNTQSVTAGADMLLTQRLHNQLRFNWRSSRGRRTDSMDDFGGAVPIDPALMLLGYTGPGPAWGRFFIQLPGMNGINADLGTEVDTIGRQFNLVDNASWVKGEHQFKFGVDYRLLAPTYGPSPYFPTLQITSQNALLNGTLDSFSIVARQGAHPRFGNYSLYAQDSWRISRRLTLDLGLRYELNPAPHDVDGKRPAVVAISSISALSTATLAPADTPFYKTFYTAFAPRVGFAYELRQTNRRQTVLRGGFGVYYDLGTGEAITGFGAYPFFTSTFLSNVPYPVPPADAAPPTFPALTLPTFNLLYGLNPDLKLPYTLQWNVSLQQVLGENQSVSLSYVGAAGRRLLTTQRLNLIPPGGTTRPNPNFGNVNYTYNGPTSDYHALQAQYQRRLSHGLQALVNYTWSHAIDEASSEIVPFSVVRGNASFDVRHNFNAAVTYDIPRPNAGRVLGSILRNWSLYSIVYLQSGQPLDIVVGQQTLSDGTRVDFRPDRVLGVPVWIQDPSAPGGRKLNRAAFQSPPIVSGSFARQGTLGRNVITGDSLYQMNMGLGRKFTFGERWYVQFKWEVFNVLNHPQFSQYITDLSSGKFGIATSTLDRTLGGTNALYQIGGSRSMQFSLRLSF